MCNLHGQECSVARLPHKQGKRSPVSLISERHALTRCSALALTALRDDALESRNVPSSCRSRASSALLCWLFLTRWFSYDCRLFHLDKQARFAAGHAGRKQGAGKMADQERIVRWRHCIAVTGKAIFWTLLEKRFHGGIRQLQRSTLNVCSPGGHAALVQRPPIIK